MRTTGILITLMVCLSACRKTATPERPDHVPVTSLASVFDAYWNGMNNNYVFWSIDHTNWDSIYEMYKPAFDKLDINNPQDCDTADTFFHRMTANLIDGHYRLMLTDARLHDTINPARERLHLRVDYHSTLPQSFFYNVIPGKYLGDPVKDSTYGTLDSVFVVTGLINSTIVYLHFNRFELFDNDNDRSFKLKPALDKFFALLQLPGIKGVIIDLRSNSGGAIRDLNLLLGRMITELLYFGYTRSKSGNNRLDYGPWKDAIVTPQQNAVKVNVPIIAMANLYSVSMAEITSMAIHTLPNGQVLGERTWGANGLLTNIDRYNDGQFTFGQPAFGWVYTPSAMFKYKDGNIYEGIGFPPDDSVPYDGNAVNSYRDPQLEAAIAKLR